MVCRLLLLVPLSLFLTACMAARTLEPAAESPPAGITPLTLEQDRMMEG